MVAEEILSQLAVLRDDIEKIAEEAQTIGTANTTNVLKMQMFIISQQKVVSEMFAVLTEVYNATQGASNIAMFAPKSIKLPDLDHTMEKIGKSLKEIESEFIS